MQQNSPHISIVSPVYGCKTCLAELYLRLKASLEKITPDFEIILVNDASPDNAWPSLQELAARDTRVKAINLSRNFGQHYAITAGLQFAKGDWVVVMDCDLQDQPEEIAKLYAKAQEGFDIVFARRAQRQDSFLKRMSSKYFYKVYNYLSGLQMDSSIANFGIYKANVIEACNNMKEYARGFPSLISYVGFTRCAIDVEHALRKDGKSSYTLYTLSKLAFNMIISNSNKPLKLTIKLGFIISALSFALALYNVAAKLVGINHVQGFTSTIFSIWFVGGMLMFVLGIIGLYLGKIYDQVKDRQLFIVRDTINIE